jgi:hypothetical protein
MLSYAFWGTWWRSVRLEPTHLIWIGMGGTVCSVVLLGVGMIWSAQKPTAPGGAQESSTAATFVPQVPKLPTATDREGFRAALGELAGMLDELTRQAAISPDDIATSRPLAQPPYTSAGIPLAKLRERLAAFQELDNRLFATGEGPFFREKPLYRAELLHLMPADTQQKWVGFNVALHNFIDALQLLKDAESPFDREKFQRAEKVAGFSQLPYAIAVRELREWAALVHSRIKATIEAIP